MGAVSSTVTSDTTSAVRPSKNTSTSIGTIAIGAKYNPPGMKALSPTASTKNSTTSAITNVYARRLSYTCGDIRWRYMMSRASSRAA